MSDTTILREWFKKHIPLADPRVVQRDDGTFEFVDYAVEAMFKSFCWGFQKGYSEGYFDCSMDQCGDE